jgi:cytochrome P450
MQRISELSLPVLAVEEPAFAADPFPPFEEARRKHPWLATSSLGYWVTEYTAIRDLLAMDDRLRFAMDGAIAFHKAAGTRWGNFQENSMLSLGGESHARLRAVLASAFTPRAANQNRGLMRRVIVRLLDEWAPKGAFDFEEFASYFPISVMCGLIGADPEAIPQLRTSLETLGLAYNFIPDFLPKLEAAMETLETYLTRLVADRRAGHRLHDEPDLLDAIIETQDSRGINEIEMQGLLIFLFVAGFDTSKNLLTLIMDTLLTRPELYERCAADKEFCAKVVEETLRYKSPSTVFRLTNDDLVFRDVLIPKDTMLFFSNNMAGRDASAFPDPNVFDPLRDNQNRQLSFGRGVHICLGQYIARAQTEEGLHLIAQRLRDPKPAGSHGYRPFTGVWGLKGLPISFTPAPLRS